MLKKRIFVGLSISLAQILLFYGVYQLLFLFESLFTEDTKRTVFESLFLDWFFNDYVLVFALLNHNNLAEELDFPFKNHYQYFACSILGSEHGYLIQRIIDLGRNWYCINMVRSCL